MFPKHKQMFIFAESFKLKGALILKRKMLQPAHYIITINIKNTRLYILGCKSGCNSVNLLIFSLFVGERGNVYFLLTA